MIKKVLSIKNVGRFLNCNAVGDVELKRYNLLLAENGRGKTTLCAILRSLQTGDPAFVLGRTTLGNTEQPEIRILMDGATAIFANKNWNATVQDIAVFDSTFVSQNVHSGEVVGLDHKRKFYRVVIGKKGVDLARKIEDLDTSIRAKSTEIRQKRTLIEALIPRGVPFETFMCLPEDPAVQAKIAEKEAELKAAESVDQITNHPALSEVSLPMLPLRLEAILATSVEGVASDAERRVTEHIGIHGMGDSGEAWLSDGLGYIQDNQCPFCGQNLEGAAPLMAAYRAYFGEAYKNLGTQIEDMRREVVETLGDRQIASIAKVFDINAAPVQFWLNYCVFTEPSFVGNEGEIEEGLRGIREAALSLLATKAARPLEPAAPDRTYTEALAAFAVLRSKVDSYNETVRLANQAIEAKKAAAGRADSASIMAALSRLRAIQERHDHDGKAACSEYEAAAALKKTLEDEKTKAKRDLDEYAKGVMNDYEETLNRLLDDIDAGFRITGTRAGYPGGVASCSYQIMINDTTIDLGDEGTPLDRPSFRNTLSSGDKSTLGLAFFLTQLVHDPGKASKVVVFDDPFNSQDGFRKSWTAQRIKECGAQCAQVIVLSHDERFLGLLWERLTGLASERKCLRLLRVGMHDTAISECDIEGATQSRFQADRLALVDYYHAARGQPCDILRRIRPVIETFLRDSHSDVFTDEDTLGGIIAKVRGAGPTNHLAPLLGTLEELDDYTTRYAHGQPGSVTATIDDNELRSFVKRTLSIMGGC